MNKKLLSGSALKWIALGLMVLDHIGAVLIPNLYAKGIGNMFFDWEVIYQVLRTVGRLSFPLFCFLLVEGYQHTSSKWKYLMRLCVFAFVSEVFFDYAIYGKLFYTGKQNIYFELVLAVLLMIGTDYFEDKFHNLYLKAISIVSVWFVGALLAKMLEFDYGVYGIFSIGVLYLLRSVPSLQIMAGAFSFCWELPAPLGMAFALFYNGKRGRQNKYFFYIFYPMHLAILGLIRWLIMSH